MKSNNIFNCTSGIMQQNINIRRKKLVNETYHNYVNVV